MSIGGKKERQETWGEWGSCEVKGGKAEGKKGDRKDLVSVARKAKKTVTLESQKKGTQRRSRVAGNSLKEKNP